jgi:hypothetical protein
MNFRERLVDFGAVGAMNWTAMVIYVEFGLAYRNFWVEGEVMRKSDRPLLNSMPSTFNSNPIALTPLKSSFRETMVRDQPSPFSI